VSGLAVGDRVDRFVVEAFLGEGGISRVYKVRHHQLGTQHALKMMAVRSASLTQRLVREGRIQANLSHPGVVAVTDIIEHGGFTGLLMEFVEGRGLDVVLSRSGAPPLQDALALFRQVLAGVAAAHDAGVLHRDLKPGNILLEPQGDGVIAKVTDFGIAKVALDAEGGQTHQSDLMGTPGFMAPEQADDPTAVDARADVFSLGAVLYCLVAGRPPFAPASLPTLLEAARAGHFSPLSEVAPHVPESVARVVERCLAPDPADRYPDCRALAEALYGDGGPTFDAEVAGARPAVLHVQGAVTPAADTPRAGGAETRVPSQTVMPEEPEASPGALAAPAAPPAPEVEPAPSPGAEPVPEPGPSGKWIFMGTAALVLAALGWLLFQTWSRTGSVVPDPDRARAVIDAQQGEPEPTAAPAAPQRVPVVDAPAEEGAVDPGLDGGAADAPVAPLGSLDGAPAPAETDPGPATTDPAPATTDATADEPPAPTGPSDAPLVDAKEPPAEPPPAEDAAQAVAPAAPAPEPEPAVAMAEPPPPEPVEAPPPPPEAAPAVDLRGAWAGKLGGRPLTLRIMRADAGSVSAEIDVLVGTTYRTFQMRGPADDGGMHVMLAEEGGQGWRLDGRFSDGAISGTILPPGRKKGQAFSVRRQ
jgi:serine/threonine-protein kinase